MPGPDPHPGGSRPQAPRGAARRGRRRLGRRPLSAPRHDRARRQSGRPGLGRRRGGALLVLSPTSPPQAVSASARSGTGGPVGSTRARREGADRHVYPLEDSTAELLITAQAPQRPLATPAFRLEVDGRIVEGFEGQTILESAGPTGSRSPRSATSPSCPVSGLPDVRRGGRGRGASAHLMLAPASRDGRSDPDRAGSAPPPHNLELIFSDHNAYCLPPARTSARATSTSRASEGQRGGPFGSRRASSAHHPFPRSSAASAPPLRGALPTRRGGRGHRHPRQPPLRRRHGAEGAGEGSSRRFPSRPSPRPANGWR